MMHKLSLLLRKIKARKKTRKIFKRFEEDKAWIEKNIPKASFSGSDNVLLVRLDDIGDYILFRNTLLCYKAMYPQKQFYLLGNTAWKNLFETADAVHGIAPIWIDKNQYFKEAVYRYNVWKSLAEYKFDVVIAPALSRNLLLDDLCVLATRAKECMGVIQQYELLKTATLSESLYTKILYAPRNTYEFESNTLVAERITQQKADSRKLHLLPIPTEEVSLNQPFIGLFIGANAISRRWSNRGWRELILKIRAHYPHYTLCLLGGINDSKNCEEILRKSEDEKVLSMVGKLSLQDSMALIQRADLLVSNNSMAYHVSMASSVRTILITNGENAYRFTTFDKQSYPFVKVLYPKRFKRHWKAYERKKELSYQAVKADIRSIPSSAVFEVVVEMLR